MVASPEIPIDAASVHLVSVPLRRAYRFAGGTLEQRTLVLVRLCSGEIEGWGEASPVPGYSQESAAEVFSVLAEAIGGPPSPGFGAAPLPPGAPASARHALETAFWDLSARIAGTPLASLLGGTPRHLPVTAVVGLGTGDDGVAAARAALEAGHARVKVKLDGPRDLPRLAAIADALPAGRLAADANGSLPADMAGILAERLSGMGLAYLEQPFRPGNLTASAVLNEAVPVCLDEEVTGPDDTRRALGAGAASLVSVKPGRLGGLAAALEVLGAARSAGAGVLVGGLLESGIGRAASRALAAAAGSGEPSELAPSLGYLEHDLVTVPAVLEPGRGVAVPRAPGWGGTVDVDAVARCTLRRVDAG